MKIWTSLVADDPAGETVSIFHIHVNDTSDQVTFDTAYMHDNESLADFQAFGTDMSGQRLNYKIIMANGSVKTVLYCVGEPGQLGSDGLREGIKALPFTEVRISPGQKVVSREHTSQKKVLGVVDSCPSGMVASADLKKV